MQNLTNNQLEPVVKLLTQAIADHRSWVHHLMRSLVCHTSIDNNNCRSEAHTLCKFGKWYYGNQPDALKVNTCFLEVGKRHQEMHEFACSMLTQFQLNRKVEEREFDGFYVKLDCFIETLEQLKAQLGALLYQRDPLTGAYNRATLEEELFNIQELVKDKVNQACVMMIDLDHFKAINDNYGHSAGDEVLKLVTECILSNLRSFDKLFRYGGEEFLVSLVNTTFIDAKKIAERIRESIAQLDIHFDDKVINVTASIGMTTIDPNVEALQSLQQADEALYSAKLNGRNQVKCA